MMLVATMPTDEELDELHDQAYAAYEAGRLGEASELFAQLLEADPGYDAYHYMKGLVHKYRRQWVECLKANMQAIAVAEERNQGAEWNAALAATALGAWRQARGLWTRYGVELPEGNGLVEGKFGVAGIRLNPWSQAEVVYAGRVDPARAILLNVPLPESGFRWGDTVLNDGARTGEREYRGSKVPVFNALQLLQRSEYETFVLFVGAETPADLAALLELRTPGLGHSEDWTDSIRQYCLRCSYSVAHQSGAEGPAAHAASAQRRNAGWQVERNVGVAAKSRHDVDLLLEQWIDGGSGRWIDGVEQREHPLSAPEDGKVWWKAPSDA